MHDAAARKVDDANAKRAARACRYPSFGRPRPVRDRRVHERGHDDRVHQVRFDANALGDGPADDCDGVDAKGELKEPRAGV